MSSGHTYKTPLTEVAGTGISAKVGLIRIGEMLSGQSSTISSKKTYWTMNQNIFSTSYAWFVNNAGGSHSGDVTYTQGVRPVIKVDTTLTISKGNGTPSNPYEI